LHINHPSLFSQRLRQADGYSTVRTVVSGTAG